MKKQTVEAISRWKKELAESAGGISEQKRLLREADDAQPQNAVKMLTRAIYQHSEILTDQIDLIYRKCDELGKRVPPGIREKLDSLKSACLDYVRLVDEMTAGK